MPVDDADGSGATLDDPRQRKLGLAHSLLIRGRCRNASPVPGFHPPFGYGGPPARGGRQRRLEATIIMTSPHAPEPYRNFSRCCRRQNITAICQSIRGIVVRSETPAFPAT